MEQPVCRTALDKVDSQQDREQILAQVERLSTELEKVTEDLHRVLSDPALLEALRSGLLRIGGQGGSVK